MKLERAELVSVPSIYKIFVATPDNKWENQMAREYDFRDLEDVILEELICWEIEL